MASQGSDQKQTMKLYTLFDVESFEEKKSSKPSDSIIDIWSFTSIQGIAIFDDSWYIMATVSSGKPESPDKDMLVIYSKGVTLASTQVHHKNLEIWGFNNGKSKFVITVGEDQAEDPEKKNELNTTLKIWDPEQLLEGKYQSLQDNDKVNIDKKLKPKRIPLSLGTRNTITAVSIAEDMTAIAIGFDTGDSLYIKTSKPNLNLFICADKELQHIQLKPDQEYATPVTNIRARSPDEKNKYGVVYCSCKKGFYYYSISFKPKFTLIAKDVEVLPRAMDSCKDVIMLFASNTNELKIYRDENLETTLPLKEKGVICILII